MDTTIIKSKPPKGFPSIQDVMWQILEAIKASGGSASIAEIETYIINALSLSDEVVSYTGDSKINRFRTRCSWSRSFLKRYGALENSSGIWSITAKGRLLKREDMAGVEKEARQSSNAEEKNDGQAPSAIDLDDIAVDESEGIEESWKDALLEVVRAMKPEAFEHLSQMVLRSAGCTDVKVTGRKGDQGIDGRGVLKIGLISFHVLFQCKRYVGSVGASEVRDFRGAMSGRTDKGLFITTGRFTQGAQEEARRDGVSPIELIDGDALCQLLKDKKLGVDVTVKQVEQIVINKPFFESI
jgi:restriction system protein